jgi:hypothetical protein
LIPQDATFEEYCDLLVGKYGNLSDEELQSRWKWHRKVNGVVLSSGRGHRSQLPPEDQDLTMKQREKKIIEEALAAGHTPEYVGRRWV